MPVSNTSIYAEIGRKIREIPQEEPMLSYEWEELVQKLCASNDDSLHNIGIRELDVLLLKCQKPGTL